MSQVQKTLIGLGVLVAVAAGVLLFAYFGVEKSDEKEAEQKEAHDQLFSMNAPGEKSPDGGAPEGTISKITLTAKGETTTIEKQNGEWWVTAPVHARADKLAADTVSSKLQSDKFKSKVEEKPTADDLKKYGLDKPSFTVVAEGTNAKGEKKDVTLEGGIENTFDGSVYLRRKGEEPVYSAEGGVRWAFDKNTYDLRDKEVLVVDEAKTHSVELKSKANEWALEHFPANKDKPWRLTRPQEGDADGAMVSTIFNSLKGERAVAFPAETPEIRAALEQPLADATFTLDDGSKVRLRFARTGGGDAGVSEHVYALREDKDGAVLAEVSSNAPGTVDKPLGELKDKSVLSFNKDDVGKAVFKTEGGAEIAVERAHGADGGTTEDWTVTAPQKGNAQKWKMSSLLWSLGSLKGVKIVDESPKASDEKSKYGLGAREVTLFGKDGKELAHLLVGKEVPKETSQLYVKGGKNVIVTADASRLSELPTKVEDIVEKPPAPPPAPFMFDAGTAALRAP